MADPDIERVLHRIDQRIANLKEMKSKLVALSAELGNGAGPQTESAPGTSQTSRKQALADYLRAHGPMTRRQIMEANLMPAGSVAYCLADEKRFRRSGNKTYAPVEHNQEG